MSGLTYLQDDVLILQAPRGCVGSLSPRDVTGQCDQEVVTVAVGDQGWGGVALME